MRANEFITENQPLLNEIAYAIGVDTITVNDTEIVKHSDVIGDIDNRNVYLFKHHNQECFFFESNGKISALLILQGALLRGAQRFTDERGQITALAMFVLHELKRSFVINRYEPLTVHGKDWVISLIKSGGRGIKLKDQNGNYPDPAIIEKEWLWSKENWGASGPTEIYFESKMGTHRFPKKSDNRLMPLLTFIGGAGEIA
jgi:hypothetical protein